MHPSTSLLVFLLCARAITATRNQVSEFVNSADGCESSQSSNCSPGSSHSADLPRTPPPQSNLLPAPDDDFEPLMMLSSAGTAFASLPSSHGYTPATTPTSTTPLTSPSRSVTSMATDHDSMPQATSHSLDTTPTPLPPTENSTPTPNPTSTPHPSSSPASSHTPLLQPTTIPSPPFDLGITHYDFGQCQKHKFCLLCLDPSTTLTCFKYNCQCQRGNPATHYMAASIESCHKANLCLSCPGGSLPYSWGRMAVCLTIWKHGPLKGGANPLTNWTEDGVRTLPVGKAVMNVGAGGRGLVPGLMAVLVLGLVTGLYFALV